MTPVNWNNIGVQEPYTNPVPKRATEPAANAAQGAPNDPADVVQLSPAALREVALTGRIALNQEAGNLSSDQTSQLYSQVSSIRSQIVADKQANGGTLSPTDAQAIKQLQNQLSQTIYSEAHNGAAPPSDPNVGKAGVREALLAGRIALNEKAGNLSSDQAQQLNSQVGEIHGQITADKQADGGSLSPADARAINHLQNELSAQIYKNAQGTSSPDQTGSPA